jgi:hypothetical protein
MAEPVWIMNVIDPGGLYAPDFSGRARPRRDGLYISNRAVSVPRRRWNESGQRYTLSSVSGRLLAQRPHRLDHVSD